MKIDGPRPVTPSASRRAEKRGPGEGFAPSSASSPRASTSLTSASGVGSVDALLALQGEGDVLEGRKQAAGRALDILDALDGVRVALLDGRGEAAHLRRLTDAVRRRRAATHDSDLEDTLDQVEIRAAVELAKREKTPP